MKPKRITRAATVGNSCGCLSEAKRDARAVCPAHDGTGSRTFPAVGAAEGKGKAASSKAAGCGSKGKAASSKAAGCGSGVRSMNASFCTKRRAGSDGERLVSLSSSARDEGSKRTQARGRERRIPSQKQPGSELMKSTAKEIVGISPKIAIRGTQTFASFSTVGVRWDSQDSRSTKTTRSQGAPRMRSNVNPSMVPPASEHADVVGADRLFREHFAYVTAFLRRLGISEAAVDDAVQEVFLVAHTRGGYRPGPASARTWLGAITIRVAANARRSLKRRRETLDDRVLERHPASIAPDMVAEQRQELAQVEGVLSKMSDSHRQVFLLFALTDSSCDDIARSMGIPTGTVYSRLHAARNSFSEACASLESAA